MSVNEYVTYSSDCLVDSNKLYYKCSFEGCNKVFTRNYRLLIHMRSHDGIKPFKCNICQKAFLEKANLKVHLRTHTDERPFTCDYGNCTSSFKTSGQLKDHKNHHLNIKNNSCNYCNKSFTRKSTLKNHMLIHQDLFPYHCEYEGCNRSFREKGNMKKHMKVHMKNKINIGDLNYICENIEHSPPKVNSFLSVEGIININNISGLTFNSNKDSYSANKIFDVNKEIKDEGEMNSSEVLFINSMNDYYRSLQEFK